MSYLELKIPTPKKFWEILNQLKGRSNLSSDSESIHPDKWEEHFSKLNIEPESFYMRRHFLEEKLFEME